MHLKCNLEKARGILEKSKYPMKNFGILKKIFL
jgi:hypothetical protein